MYVVIPLFTSMGAEFGHAAADLVIASTAFGIPYAFAGLIAGPLADAWGAKKVIVLSLATTALTTFAVAFAQGYWTLAILRGLQGVTAGFLSAPSFAYIARDLDEDIRSFATTAIMAAAMSSAVIMQLFGQYVENVFGWHFAFAIVAPLIIVAMLATRRSLRGGDESSQPRIRDAIFALPVLLKRPRLICLYATAFTLLGGFVAVLAGVELYGPEDLRSNPAKLLLLRAAALPVMVAVPFIALRLSNVATTIRIIAGLGLAAIALILSAIGGAGFAALSIGLALCVAGVLIAAPAVVQSVGQAVPESSGAAISLYTFAIFIGASLGPQLSVLLTPFGITGLLWGVAAIFVGGAALGAWGSR
tara:strand:- start:417 stop:1499 length:1083 start_codon:yes stop_codon:yes gene_type:complete